MLLNAQRGRPWLRAASFEQDRNAPGSCAAERTTGRNATIGAFAVASLSGAGGIPVTDP
ncbi:hypothetical protein ACFQMJ_30560 [Cohnella cellulosilytica]|uniref:Uncharacterized protein n=1 Tax=Cohnella cellulosilytica TaxID=986710 RepID=A0ABW2FIA8_9BACL